MNTRRLRFGVALAIVSVLFAASLPLVSRAQSSTDTNSLLVSLYQQLITILQSQLQLLQAQMQTPAPFSQQGAATGSTTPNALSALGGVLSSLIGTTSPPSASTSSVNTIDTNIVSSTNSCTTSDGVVIANGTQMAEKTSALPSNATSFYYLCSKGLWLAQGIMPTLIAPSSANLTILPAGAPYYCQQGGQYGLWSQAPCTPTSTTSPVAGTATSANPTSGAGLCPSGQVYCGVGPFYACIGPSSPYYQMCVTTGQSPTF